MSWLFTPLTIRGRTFANRAWVSPMCQYSCEPERPGTPTSWHAAHLGSLALGGPGLIMAEATAVTFDGRITPYDTGIWTDRQADVWQELVGFAQSVGVPMGLQLAHAGRKASTWHTWSEVQGSVPADQGGWSTTAPSALPFEGYEAPRELDEQGIHGVVDAFVAAAARAADCGFAVLEIHAAHGYLLHQFLSPLSNHRSDEWGGSFAGRTRLTVTIARAVRDVWPDDRPLFVRLSATDWVEGGWALDDSVRLARELADVGVDVIDCSSGGLVAGARIPVAPGYQVEFARAVREGAGMRTVAVGRISAPEHAEAILAAEDADAVMMGRAFLRNPRWAQTAAASLGEAAAIAWPAPYHTVSPTSAPLTRVAQVPAHPE